MPTVPEPSDNDLTRIYALLRRIGGQHVSWGAASVLEVYLVEQRLAAEESASRRLIRATWVLAVATVVLAFATVALIVWG